MMNKLKGLLFCGGLALIILASYGGLYSSGASWIVYLGMTGMWMFLGWFMLAIGTEP